jgi:hypothetical protein
MSDNCEKYESLFDEFIDNEIDENYSIKLKKHIFDCADCRQKLELLRVTNEMMKEAIGIDDSSLDVDQAWREFDSKMDWGPTYWERIRNKFFKPIVWLPALCTAAIVIFVITILPIQTGTKQKKRSRVMEVSCTIGSPLIMKTSKSKIPLIMIISDTKKEAG